jgi:hypothetical protein
VIVAAYELDYPEGNRDRTVPGQKHSLHVMTMGAISEKSAKNSL